MSVKKIVGLALVAILGLSACSTDASLLNRLHQHLRIVMTLQFKIVVVLLWQLNLVLRRRWIQSR